MKGSDNWKEGLSLVARNFGRYKTLCIFLLRTYRERPSSKHQLVTSGRRCSDTMDLGDAILGIVSLKQLVAEIHNAGRG